MPFTKVSVLIPTRTRLDRLQRVLTTFKDTTSGCSELAFRIDDDDPVTAMFLHLTDWPVYQGSRREGYESMPLFLQDAASVATGDVFMVGNDDMAFVSQGWDAAILAEANKYPDGLFNIGVATHNADHYPFSIISKRMVQQLGHVYDPRIFWGDIYLRDLLAHFGRTIMLPEVRIDHEWAGFKPDALFWEAQDLKTGPYTNGPEYWERHRNVVNDSIRKLEAVGAALA